MVNGQKYLEIWSFQTLKVLAKCDPKLDVVLSKDAEGNAFKLLACLQECMVDLDNKEQAALVLWPDD